MADASSKRNSATTGKVATPKATTAVSPQAMQDPRHILTISQGARLQVKTTGPQAKTHQGVLFTADAALGLIALNCTPAPPNPSTSLISQPGDYHIIPIRHIQSFTLLSVPDDSSKADDTSVAGFMPTNVDTRRLKEREEKAVQKRKDDEKKRGKGVSVEAQELFNVLERMYTSQTRWEGQSIILMDSVRIDPPYSSDDCKAPKDKQNMLPHVKKVVEGERRKIAGRVGTPPNGARKGG